MQQQRASTTGGSNGRDLTFQEQKLFVIWCALQRPKLKRLRERFETTHPLRDRKVWLGTVEGAALRIHGKMQNRKNADRSVRSMCKEFLSNYVIEGKENYTVHKLANVVYKIRGLKMK